VGPFGHPKRPFWSSKNANVFRLCFGLIVWAVFDVRVGRFGFGPFWSFASVFRLLCHAGQAYSNTGMIAVV